MNIPIKWFPVVLLLASVLVLPLFQAFIAYAAEPSAQEKTLSFLRDVVLLDLTKYNVTLVSHDVSYPAEYGDISEEEVRYKLEAEGNVLDITFTYRNGILVFFLMDDLQRLRPPSYVQAQPANLVDAAKGFLERYQKWSGSSRYQELMDVLDLVKKVDNITVRLGNVKLEINAEGSFVSFSWSYLYDGLELPGPSIAFRNGDVWDFGDTYSIFKVGSTAVNVSKEEAIKIARERAKNFSWKVGVDPATQIEVKNFTILEEPVKAELSLQAREPLTLYPFWRVELYLDKIYPGFVTAILVGIWADTGEIRYVIPLSTGGGPPPEDSTMPPGEPSPTPQPTSLPMEYGYAIVAVTVVAIAAIGYLYLKRKK
jgi:hypothetical protein